MTTFWERLKPYYYQTESYAYRSVQPWPTQRSDYSAYKVNVEDSFTAHQVDETVRQQLDALITPEMHAQLVATSTFDATFFKNRGFRVLKGSDSRVLTHPAVPGYLIKTSVQKRNFKWGTIPGKTGRVPIQHTNLLRAHGHEYYQRHNTNQDVFSFPNEYLYQSPHALPQDGLHERYYAISQQAEVYSRKQSCQIVASLSGEEQIRVAEKVCTFIKETGLTDMHAGNLLVTRHRDSIHFTVIDQEPLYLYVEHADRRSEQYLYSREDCALIGLMSFRDHYCRRNGLSEMALCVDQQIEEHIREHHLNVRTYSDQIDTYYYANWTTYALILITIPFFFIILPLLTLHSHCTEPSRYQLV
ncbi:MAG: hypothetical protein S4CHLAM2_01760 [Chlamydiales bacterium]|nr:hypothetical protein [Chlamydiales bacterium]